MAWRVSCTLFTPASPGFQARFWGKIISRGFPAGETHSTSVDLAGAVCKVLDVSLDDFFGILPRDSDLVGPEVHRLRAQVELYERAVRKKDRWIRALAIALGAVLLGIIAMLAIDLLRHDVGWFQFSI